MADVSRNPCPARGCPGGRTSAALLPDTDLAGDAVLADQTLYGAKREGRNRVVIADPDDAGQS